MAAYATLSLKQDQLIRKALDGSLFVAETSAASITAITGTDSSLAALPTGWSDTGLMTDAGMAFTRNVTVDELSSFGRVDPSRSDVTQDTGTLVCQFQETNVHTLSLFTGADPATLIPTTASGELAITKPTRPTQKYKRLLALAVDQSDGGEFYIARYWPRAKVTDYENQAYLKGNNAIEWGVTFTSYVDDVLGYAERYFIAGPGAKALLTAMGLPSS